jgi:hypothetical protein
MSDLIAGLRGNLGCTAMDRNQFEREIASECETQILNHAKLLCELLGTHQALEVLADIVRMVGSEPPERSLH